MDGLEGSKLSDGGDRLCENKYRVLISYDGDPFIKKVPEVNKPVGSPEAYISSLIKI